MHPSELHVVHSLLPFLQAVVERQSHYVESLALILVIRSLHVRHLGAARSAPACPEVDEYVVALTAIFGELVRIAVHVVLGDVNEWLSDDACLLGKGSEILSCTSESRVRSVCTFRVEHLLQFRIFQVVHDVIDESGGDEVVLVFIHNLLYALHELVRESFQLRRQFSSEFLQLFLALASLLRLAVLHI